MEVEGLEIALDKRGAYQVVYVSFGHILVPIFILLLPEGLNVLDHDVIYPQFLISMAILSLAHLHAAPSKRGPSILLFLGFGILF